MFKMVKYEYRKNLMSLIIMLVILSCIQLYFFGSIIAGSKSNTAISLTLFMFGGFASYAFVLIYGILTYSKDLKNKEGYLVFMAPLSTYKIIGAKLISTLFTGITLVALIGLFGTLDIFTIYEKYNLKFFKEIFDITLNMSGYTWTKLIFNILAFILTFLLEFFMGITIAYLAISLSSTILQNKKGKGIISFIFFIVFMIITTTISNKIPNIDVKNTLSFANIFISAAPTLAFILCVIIGCFIGSAKLLQNKISL